jgi:hypothetical protein
MNKPMNTPQDNPEPQPNPKKHLEVLTNPTTQAPDERGDPKLTEEVEVYLCDSIQKLQNKIITGGRVTAEDWAFNDEVNRWKRMPKKWREKLKSVESMKKETDEASKRHLSLKQWLGLLDLADHVGEKDRIRWVDKTFRFPGKGRITAHRGLHFGIGKIAIPLPEGLEFANTEPPATHDLRPFPKPEKPEDGGRPTDPKTLNPDERYPDNEGKDKGGAESAA